MIASRFLTLICVMALLISGCNIRGKDFVFESVIGIHRINIAVETDDQEIPFGLRKDVFPQTDEEFMRQIIPVLESDDFQKRVGERLEPYEKPEWGRTTKPMVTWQKWIKKHVTCDFDKKTNVIRIQARHPDYSAAVILSDTFAKEIIRLEQEKYISIQQGAIKWLSDQISQTLGQIAEFEKVGPGDSLVETADREARLSGLKHRLEALNQKKAIFEVNANLNASPLRIVDYVKMVND